MSRHDWTGSKARLERIGLALAEGRTPEPNDLRWLLGIGWAARRIWNSTRCEWDDLANPRRVVHYEVSRAGIENLFRALKKPSADCGG